MRVRYDWRAYFRKFCEVHGEPVKWRGKLLFRDGWAYSASNHAGPEYAPPLDPSELIREYWTLRRAMVQAKIDELAYDVETVFLEQSRRSAPLQHVTSYRDEDGKLKVESTDVDRAALVERMRWLVDEAKECDRMLKEAIDGGESLVG